MSTVIKEIANKGNDSMRERNEDWKEAFESGLSQKDIGIIIAIDAQDFDKFELNEICLKFGVEHKMSEAISIQEANEA